MVHKEPPPDILVVACLDQKANDVVWGACLWTIYNAKGVHVGGPKSGKHFVIVLIGGVTKKRDDV
jgi:hypothetical protein